MFEVNTPCPCLPLLWDIWLSTTHVRHATLNHQSVGPTCPIEPTAQMDASDLEESPSRPPIPHLVGDKIYFGHYPKDLPYLGPPPSHEKPIEDFNAQNRPAQGHFPSQSLQGPGHFGPPSPPLPNPPTTTLKRKRTVSPEHAAAGGSGLTAISDSSDEEPDQLTADRDSSPTIKLTERKNTAYDIWAFTRPVETNEDITADRWPDDYNHHLTKRPETPFIGCKLCTQFGSIFLHLFRRPKETDRGI